MEKRLKKWKKEKGITLIALVITIIVLLILAAVSIATLTGENGILSKAGDSSEKTKKADAKERVVIEVIGSYDETGTLNLEDLNNNLMNNLDGIELKKGSSFSLLTNSNKITELPATVKYNEVEVEIEANGNVKNVASGENNEQLAKTVEELKSGNYVMYNSPKGDILCRVLYDEEYNSTEGKDYGVQIISDNAIGEEIILDESFAKECGWFGDLDTAFDNYFNILNEGLNDYKNDSIVSMVRLVCTNPENGTRLPYIESRFDHEDTGEWIDDKEVVIEDHSRMEKVYGDFQNSDMDAFYCGLFWRSHDTEAETFEISAHGDTTKIIYDLNSFYMSMERGCKRRLCFKLNNMDLVGGTGTESNPYLLQK